MHYDLPLEELRRYRPCLPVPDDLEAFWAATLARSGGAAAYAPVASGLATITTYDVTLPGFDGAPVRAWLHLPAAGRGEPVGRLPGVVQFQGYNGGRGLAHEHVLWASAGYAHLVVDTRGQGSGWTTGATGDPVGSGPAQPGFLTRGIDGPETYYYRRVYADAVAAVEALRAHERVDAARVAVVGASQGGGIAAAVAALARPSVAAALIDVPFLCDFRRAAALAPGEPYLELVRYLAAHPDRAESTFATLAYFDAAVLGQLATAPALFSVALMDQTCPPSTSFAAYHHYGSRADAAGGAAGGTGPGGAAGGAGPARVEKELAVYEYNDHEGGGAHHQARQLAWLAEIFGA